MVAAEKRVVAVGGGGGARRSGGIRMIGGWQTVALLLRDVGGRENEHEPMGWD